MKNKTLSLNKCNTAVYIRLSRDEGDNLDCENIDNRKETVKYFKNKNNLCIVTECVDDGHVEPDFNKIIENIIKDLKSQKINFSVNRYKISGFISFFRRA
jgi:hypothetical protein